MARSPDPEVVEPVAPRVGGVSGRTLPVSLLVSLRPEQWTKNVFVFAGLMFGYYQAADQLQASTAIARTLAAFAIFCALSSVVYLLNDVADREGDREHPLKCRRPIACGDLSVGVALTAAAVIAVVALTAAFWLTPFFGAVSLLYVSLITLYSTRLKHVVILDVLTLAIGFVLRTVAGAVVIDVAISHWLVVCTILLALFLALSKRRHELTLLTDRAADHRRILGEYSPYLLDQMISVVTASTLIAYIFYTISPETQQKFHTPWLGLTIPFPLYGIFRYLYLVHQKEGGGSPTTMLMNDRPLLVCVALWAVAVVVIIYRPFGF
jgi:4-hydroxybenzoate polyprenyltransferase